MRNGRGPRPQKVGTYGDAKPFQGTLQCRLAPRVLGEIRGKSRWRGYESLTLARRGKPTSFTRSCAVQARRGPARPAPGIEISGTSETESSFLNCPRVFESPRGHQLLQE